MFCLKTNRLFLFRSSNKASQTRIEGDTVGPFISMPMSVVTVCVCGVYYAIFVCVWCVLCNLCLCILGVVRDLSLIRVNFRGHIVT